MNLDDIRRNLENEYDIPFSVQQTVQNGEPVFIMGPLNEDQGLFYIRISFRNRIRLYMDFVPEKYSAQFIRAMAARSPEDKRRFMDFALLMENKGAKCHIKVNDISILWNDIESWPEEWYDLTVHITKMPVMENGEDYLQTVDLWGSMMMGMILSLADIVPVNTDEITQGYEEGRLQRTEVNRYERNPLNRKLCLLTKGYDCQICGMNFEQVYGERGKNFIHVHHIIPVSRMSPGYIIDAARDLIPVCPNCHAMLHRSNPPILPDELKQIIENRK